MDDARIGEDVRPNDDLRHYSRRDVADSLDLEEVGGPCGLRYGMDGASQTNPGCAIR